LDNAVVIGEVEPASVSYKPHTLPWHDVPEDHFWPSATGDELVSIFNTTGPGMILPVAPLKPSRKSEFQIQYLGESFQHTHTMVPADQTPAELQQELANETSSRHVRDLWAAFHQSFQKVWQQRVQALPKQPPGKEQANLTFQS
jgi:hypothetical protein